MSQETIGQRIKFLMDAEGLSIRKLARAIDVSDTNIRNYISRDSKPSSDVIEKLVRIFPRINTAWLVTGDGEPFIDIAAEPTAIYQNQTKNKGNQVGINHGTNTQTQGADGNCQQQLEAAQELIRQLKSQLTDKERLIQLLEKAAK